MSLTKILTNNPSSDALYAIIQSQTGTTWNSTSLVTYVDGDYLDYDVALSQIAGILYGVNFPSSLPSDVYTVTIKIQDGSAPATDDSIHETKFINWTGSLVTINQQLGGAFENTRVLINNSNNYYYYMVVQDEDGKTWNGSSLVTYNASNYSTYCYYFGKITDILYGVNFPIDLDVDDYIVTIKRRLSTAPAVSDTVIETRYITWNGVEDTQTGIYQTISQAQTYFNDILTTDAWDNSDNNKRLKALKEATKIIDRLPLMTDYVYTDKQDTDIPNDIKYACNEIAYALLDGVNIEREFQSLGVDSQTFSNTRVAYKDYYLAEHVLAGVPSLRAWLYIKPYLRDTKSIKLERVN